MMIIRGSWCHNECDLAIILYARSHVRIMTRIIPTNSISVIMRIMCIQGDINSTEILSCSKSLLAILLATIVLVSLALVSMPIAYSQMLSTKAAEKFLQPSPKLIPIQTVEITSPSLCNPDFVSTEIVKMSAQINNTVVPPSTLGHFRWYIDNNYVGEGNPLYETVYYG